MSIHRSAGQVERRRFVAAALPLVVLVVVVGGVALTTHLLATADDDGPLAADAAAPADRRQTWLSGVHIDQVPPQSARRTDEPTLVADLPHGQTPATLRIPTIGVASDMIELGLNGDGTLEVPDGDDYDRAGWYRNSPRPGELGPAIVAGHVDSRAGPSVFFRLHELVAGDEIRLAYADGTTVAFTVTARERYPKAVFPTERVYGDLDHAGLRLITCGGELDRDSGHYRDNVIVFAELSRVGPA